MAPRRRILSFVSIMAVLFCACMAFAEQRVVDLTAPDSVKLKATYFPAAKSGPGVLLLHQCNRQRKVWDELAQQLSAAGINVLTVDYRGFGESGGAADTPQSPRATVVAQRQKWPADIDLAFQYLLAQPGVDKNMIGVGGASCGVDNSIQTAIRHPEVHSLVLLSGPTNRAGRQYLRTDKDAPAFFAAADDDEFPGTVTEMEWLYYITGDPGKKYAHYATGGHGADIFKLHPDLMTQITAWYVTTLIKTPGKAPAPKDSFKPSQEVLMLSMIDQPGGATKVSQMIEKDPSAKPLPEDTVNLMGYELLQSGDTQTAIEVMKLNVKAYPKSPNAYDSLADAYLAAGQKEQAREASQKALEMLATDTTDTPERRAAIKQSAEDRLKQLQPAPQ
jgi:dienelactone hydrolase